MVLLLLPRSYMAPECFAGCNVGEKADVYSLACLLLECVTGERPWQGLNVVQVVFQVCCACHAWTSHVGIADLHTFQQV